jgi:tRNA (guanine37-N1)-methyltransferase
MRIDVFTLFPEWFGWFNEQRHMRNLAATGTVLNTIDYRDTTPLKGGRVDDSPYGGGAGMVMRVDVVDAALQGAYGDNRDDVEIILLSPSGTQLDDRIVDELAAKDHIALLCGRYEGIDDRVREHLVDRAISIGPYVLSGGEPAAMVIADAVTRRLPGALGHEESAVHESFSAALDGDPEYPHYTRPPEYRGWTVPDVLLSGDHARIESWRREQSRKRAQEPGVPTLRQETGEGR